MSALTLHRAALALVVGLALGLAGCETADITDKVTETVQDFNPFGAAKKKLPGERKPVFPEGVPGVQQGVPPDLLVGAQPETANPPAAQSSLAEPKPKASARRRARTSTPVRRQARPAERLEPDARPPASARTTRRPAQAAQPAAAWPDPSTPPPAAAPAQAARPAPAQSQNAWPTPAPEPAPTVWPDPPKTGTFTR